MTDHTPQPSQPSVAQIVAMIRLLGDDLGPLQESARRRLLGWGALAVPQLREGAEAEHIPTRMRCRALLREVELQGVLERFAGLRLGGRGEASAAGLLDGALLAARVVRTFVPGAASMQAKLRQVARDLRTEVEGRSAPARARLLAARLHEELGLNGCDADQLDISYVQLVQELFGGDASKQLVDRLLLDRVVNNRVGAPIALSLIYILVARWAGMSAAGVALPDHFLVRVHGDRPQLIDPFHGGRVVTKTDCARFLRRAGHRRVKEHLQDLDDRAVLIRYLRSLREANRRAAPESYATLGTALGLLEIR